MQTHGYADKRDQLLVRVNRLDGQVRGVGRMIEEDGYCIDVVNQPSAVQAAARELSLQFLESHVHQCVEAHGSKAPVQRPADSIAAYCVPVILVLAAVTLAGWLAADQVVTAAITAAIAVLISACTCALGLATPTAIMVGTGSAAQPGILIRGGETLVNRAFLDDLGVDPADLVEEPGHTGATSMYVVADGHPLGRIAVADGLRPESRRVVSELESLGLEVWMLTGDNETAAREVARQSGIERVLADVLPADKASKIRELQAGGRAVAMVGHGINNARPRWHRPISA